MAATMVRTVVMYLLVMVAMRLMGKRQIGQLEPSELVITIMISELAALPMQDAGIPLMNSVVPVTTLICLEIFLSFFVLKSIRMRVWVCGKPCILMSKGQIDQKELSKNRMTADELIEELRGQNVTDLSTVQYAILETSGTLSVVLYPEYQPATAGDVGKDNPCVGFPSVVISDGRWLDNNLTQRGVNRKWVLNQLKSKGLSNPHDVFLCMVDEQKGVYALPKERKKA